MCWGQSWAEGSPSTFSWLYILVCAVVQKYHEMFSQKKIFLVPILQSTCFICITWKRKQIIDQQPHCACGERTKSNKNKINKTTSYSKRPCVLLFALAHKQCNGIIKGWLHCLMLESKGRFLANNTLLAWCLVMVQIQFTLIKQNKDWASRTLANPYTPYVG